MEVIFYNKALMKILDEVSDLSKFIEKNVFHTQELENPLSLSAAAQNRYSENVLSQVYRMG